MAAKSEEEREGVGLWVWKGQPKRERDETRPQPQQRVTQELSVLSVFHQKVDKLRVDENLLKDVDEP